MKVGAAAKSFGAWKWVCLFCVVLYMLCSPFPLFDEEVWWRTRMLHTCPEVNNSFWSADGTERTPGEKYLERNTLSFIFSVYGSIFKSMLFVQCFLFISWLWMWNGYYRKLSIMHTSLLLNCMRIIKERYITLQTSVACASMNPFWCLVMSPLTRCQVLK